MPRKCIPLEDRVLIETSPVDEEKDFSKCSPLFDLQSKLKHQKRFLDRLEDQHKKLTKLEADKARLTSRRKGPVGPSVAAFDKYQGYAEQLVLLEAINAFEVFYKNMILGLARLLRNIISPDQIKEKIEARIIWSLDVDDFIDSDFSPTDLIFESKLFHRLSEIDEATNTLVGQKSYISNSASMTKRMRAIERAFQIRHTLSHNCGLVTKSDAVKFQRLGCNISTGSVLDPSKNYLRRSVMDLLRTEANDFTNWLREKTIALLKAEIKKRGLNLKAGETLPGCDYAGLFLLLDGTNADWQFLQSQSGLGRQGPTSEY